MKKDRLLRLADKLEETGPYEGEKLTKDMRFNLDSWCQCGTVACAVGHAAYDEWFRRRGLKLETYDLDYGLKVPVYQEWRDDEAVEEFFDIGAHAVEQLFYAQAYPAQSGTRPKTVAKRIREFVASHDQEAS